MKVLLGTVKKLLLSLCFSLSWFLISFFFSLFFFIRPNAAAQTYPLRTLWARHCPLGPLPMKMEHREGTILLMELQAKKTKS